MSFVQTTMSTFGHYLTMLKLPFIDPRLWFIALLLFLVVQLTCSHGTYCRYDSFAAECVHACASILDTVQISLWLASIRELCIVVVHDVVSTSQFLAPLTVILGCCRLRHSSRLFPLYSVLHLLPSDLSPS